MIVACCGQKGGSGKTTAATNIATEYHRQGQETLLVDADPQGTIRTWANIAAEAGRPAPVVVAMGDHLHRDLPALAEKYGRVVLDCPPMDSATLRSALMVADLAVLPCKPSPTDLWALQSSVVLVKEAQSIRPQLRAGVLISQRDSRTVMGTKVRSALSECGLAVLETSLGYRVAYVEAFGFGQGVTRYAAKSAAAKEITALVSEIEALLKSEVAADAA